MNDLAGRVVVELDLDGVTDKAGRMDRPARAPALPDRFGRNRDALADSLSDPSVWPQEARGRGLPVVVRGRREYAKARPAQWGTAQEVFGQATDVLPELTVALALGGTS